MPLPPDALVLFKLETRLRSEEVLGFVRSANEGWAGMESGGFFIVDMVAYSGSEPYPYDEFRVWADDIEYQRVV